MDYKQKYLKYKQKYEMLKKQQRGGSYVMEDSVAENPSQFKNADVFDTLNGETTKKIFDNELDQTQVNKLLVTAILTLNNKINYLTDELNPILSSKYATDAQKESFKFSNPKLYEVIFSEEKKEA